ncbi:MAG: tandem-95 repeat protein [Thermoplasmatota archaeon]
MKHLLTGAAPLLVILAVVVSSTVQMEGGPSAAGPLELLPADSPDLPPWGYYKGMLPNPLPGDDLYLLYSNVSGFNQFVPVWGRPSPFYNLSADLSGDWGRIFVEDLIRGNDMFPLVHLNFFGQGLKLIQHPSLATSDLSSDQWRSRYIQAAKDAVNASRPLYLSLGNEVNRWFEKYGLNQTSGNGFQYFISLYNEAYDAVKEISPQTKVFCTFSREIVSENREANLSVLDLFDPDRMDVLVFTSYPFAVAGINRVGDMDDDYYSKAYKHFERKPFGLSEVAWSSNSSFGGEEGQAAFISDLFTRLTVDRRIDVEFLGWSWLHDLAPEDETGLIDRNNDQRKGFEAWKNNREPTYNRSNRMISLTEDFGTHEYPLNQTFSDPDPWDVLTFKLWNGTHYTNRTSSRVDAEIVGGSLVLRSQDNVTGTSQFMIQVSDWCGDTNWTLLQVSIENVNDPPTVAQPLPDPYRFSEGLSSYMDLSYYIFDSDNDIDELSVDVVRSPHINASSNLAVSPFLVLFTEEEDWFGSTYLLFDISDPEGSRIEINMTVEVLPINDPPLVSIPAALQTPEDTPLEVHLDEWAEDRDGDPLFWNISTYDPQHIALSMEGTSLLITPAADWFGLSYLRVNVTDGSEFSYNEVPISVISVNDPPVARRTVGLDIREDEDVYLPLSSLDPRDPDGDPIYWSLGSSDDIFRSISLPPNGTVHIKPGLDLFGSGNFSLILGDGRGGELEIFFNVYIAPVNDPPLFIGPDGWNVGIAPGSFILLDLSQSPLIVEDPDDPVDALEAVTDYTLASADGLLMNISLPPDISSSNFSITIVIVDRSGDSSEPQELLIRVLNEGGSSQEVLKIDNVTISSADGKVIVKARGEPLQNIWVVFRSSKGILGSYELEEKPYGSGSYMLELEDPPWEDGIEVTAYLSRTENGENDSELPLSYFTFQAKGGADGNGSHLTVFIWILLVISVVSLLLVLFFMLRRGRVTEFDYDSLLEE